MNQRVQEQFVAVAQSAGRERRYAYGIALVALALAAFPYIYGYLLTPKGSQFIGQIFAVDDYFVYLSWTRQAVEGHFYARNLFTTDPQGVLQFNTFFLLAGYLVSLTGQPPDIVLQALRLLCAVGALKACYEICRLCFPADRKAKLTAFAFMAVGSGIGWIHQFKDHDLTRIYPSADSNQPEALVFTSVYYAALMGFGTMLIAASMYFLLKTAMERQARYAVGAGLTLLVLGNVHTYDVIHVAAAWTLFWIAKSIVRRRIDFALLFRSLLAGVIALPSVLNQYFILHHNTVFYQRALQATTLTPNFVSYIIGYGLILILAAAGVRYVAIPAARKAVESDKGITSLAMVCWAIAGLAIIYAVPYAFQRKLIMGEDIPLSILASMGLSYMAQVLPTPIRRMSIALTILVTMPSTLIFVLRDLAVLKRAGAMTGTIGAPYLSHGEDGALHWIQAHTKEESTVLAPPRMSLLIPGYTGRTVWAGHWGETPRCAEKLGKLSAAWSSTASDQQRRSILKNTGVDYVCYPNDPKHPSLGDLTPDGVHRRYADLAHDPPSYLRPVYHNSEYTVFSVVLP